MGIVTFVLFLIYSFIILSSAELLLFLRDFMHLIISSSVIDELRISSSSVISIFIVPYVSFSS